MGLAKTSIAPNDRQVSNVLVNFVTDSEVDMERAGQLRELTAKEIRLEDSCRGIKLTPRSSLNEQDNSLYIVLNRTREVIQTLTNFLTYKKREHVAECDAIHGITRRRVAKILNELEAGTPVAEKEIEAPPSILDEVKAYLAGWGITDRLSYEVKLFTPVGRSGEGRWYGNCGVGGIFPWNLLQLVLRKKVRPNNPIRKDLVTAGDVLYGRLNRHYCMEVLRQAFIAKGITSSAILLAADYRRTIEPIIADSPFKLILMVGRILKKPGCSYLRPKELLAGILFGETVQ